LETEKSSLIEQVDVCHQEEQQLTQQLAFLHNKFIALESTLEKMLESEKELQHNSEVGNFF